MACLAGVCLCCCAEGEWLCSFTFSSCALTTFVTLNRRALRGVYFLTRASVLRRRVVAFDINASVNALVIHDPFFMNASDAPFPVIYCMRRGI